MAVSTAIARRYAQAYFELAQEVEEVPAWRDALARAVALLTADESATLLANPRVSGEDRAQLVDALLGDVLPATRNLARLLVDRGRARLLPEVLDEFDRLADRASGVVRAEVTAAVPLDDAVAASIGRTLSERLGGEVHTITRHDPAILGGLVIRIGDRVIDGSVRARLQQLQAALA